MGGSRRVGLRLISLWIPFWVQRYHVALGGEVDALGIGEKAVELRRLVGEKCRCLGFEIDEERNGREITDLLQDVGREGARHRMLVCQTDEQFEMAWQCATFMQ